MATQGQHGLHRKLSECLTPVKQGFEEYLEILDTVRMFIQSMAQIRHWFVLNITKMEIKSEKDMVIKTHSSRITIKEHESKHEEWQQQK